MMTEWRSVRRQAGDTGLQETETLAHDDQQTAMTLDVSEPMTTLAPEPAEPLPAVTTAEPDQQTLAGHDETDLMTDQRTRFDVAGPPREVARDGDAPVDTLTDAGNPVVNRLLEQAAARYGRDAISFVTADEFVRGGGSEPDTPQADNSAGVAPEPETRPGADAPSKGNGILRSMALKLVEKGVLQERRAVAISIKARDSGISFLRMLARDRQVTDIRAVFDLVAEWAGTTLIQDKAGLLSRMQHVDWLTPELAERFEIIPLKPENPGEFRYATVDPFDAAVSDWIQRRSQGQVLHPVALLPEVLVEGLDRYRLLNADNDSNDSGMFVPIEISWGTERNGAPDLSDWDVPVVVDYILHRSHELGASDIHIEPTGDSVVVRNRVDGVLHEEFRLPAAMQAPVISRIKVLSNLDVAERRLPQDGRISVTIRSHPIDIRVSTLPTVTGEKIVMRLLDETALRPRPESLGLSDHDLALLLDKVSAPYGMIMLSGPTGSGKTTTLYSCLSSIDRVARNVVTVEDPVEYRLTGVHQTQVNESLGMTFATSLRTILRQDPDVIMVGECRDQDTAQMAVQASLTGHLVFSTIHANDAAGVVNRLLDMKVEPFLIANALSLVIAQRLVRVHCEHCAVTVEGREILSNLRAEGVSAARLTRLGIEIDPEMPYASTVGCNHCRHTGYFGRQAVYELFSMTEDLRALVMEPGFQVARFRKAAREEGMLSMLENATFLVEEGRTSFSEVIRVLGDV